MYKVEFPLDIWRCIMIRSDLKSITFLSQTCWDLKNLFEYFQKNDIKLATRFRIEGQLSLALKSLQKCADNGNAIGIHEFQI